MYRNSHISLLLYIALWVFKRIRLRRLRRGALESALRADVGSSQTSKVPLLCHSKQGSFKGVWGSCWVDIRQA